MSNNLWNISIEQKLSYFSLYSKRQPTNALNKIKDKDKINFHPRTDHEGPDWELMYRSTFSLTSALVVSGWSTPRPARFIPGNPVPIVYEAGWASWPAWPFRKISPPPVFDPRTVQPVVSRYTDRAIPALLNKVQ